ncbi:hypothetical protein KIN20_004459 [Parelaphostrongylus tenuis]|uniref:FH2 domain-containing protein n=1 Tax=Parelaphostrongylus tenuis TaxID=148309 RepID=A0AAD5QF56_PARTN|nr:hypothetical protein KIN20_004459 [Parelaphostrongylus tenuis]
MIDGMFSITQHTQQPLSETYHTQSMKKKRNLVDLLTPKRSQNVAITLKQFKNLDSVIAGLHDNKVEQFDVEMLRTLKAILPDSDEIVNFQMIITRLKYIVIRQDKNHYNQHIPYN